MNGDNLVGGLLGERYEILDKIGAGGMATVYKAKDTVLNRNVAIKILRDSLEGEESVVTNFVKEAQASAGLVHNNIVSVYDVCESDGLNYMVMELVEGITLKQYIKEKGMLPWQEACDYAIQVGQGLHEAHSKNVIHCDIKPQNIIMTADKTLKVADFGIAKAVSGGTMVVGGAALGSVHYISPEQARGGFTDPRSDIYSLGIVLYEMLAGRVPFDGDTAVGVAMKHLEEEPVDVRCINLDIPKNLAYIVMKAISKEQSSRYETAQDMLNDLHAVLASEPLPSKILAVKEEVEEEKDEEVIDDIFDDKTKSMTDTMSDNQRITRVKQGEKEKGKKTVKKGKSKLTRAQKKANRISTLLAFATIIVIALIGFGAYNIVTNFVMKVSIPDFTNMTIEEAKAIAKEKELVILDENIEYSISDTTADGRIITQEPPKGDSVDKNTVVTLVVSIGSRGGNIAVPNLKSYTRAEALEAINSAGLKATVIEESSKTVSGDAVIRQIPIAGTKLFAGDYVTIYVSKGIPTATKAATEEKVYVPALMGISLDEARIRLSEAGLTLGSVNVTASSDPYGTVVSQTVGEGAQVNKGSSIGVLISGGEEVAPEVPEGEVPDEGETSNEGGESSSNGEAVSESGTTTFFVSIPSGDASETVYVEVYVNGSLIHEGNYSKGSGTVPVDITGSGEVNVVAYVDGVSQSQTINFGN